jgi:hypothetical protein
LVPSGVLIPETHGTLRPDDTEPAMSESPAHLAWWLLGDRGRVRLEILLSPERPPKVQKLAIQSVAEPSPGLVAIAERVVAQLGGPGADWPRDVELAETVDRRALDRTVRAAEASWGPVTLGPVIAGDGRTTARWRLPGPRGDLELEIALAGDDSGPTDRVARVVLTRRPIHLPITA